MKKMQMILVMLGLTAALYVVGCSDDDDGNGGVDAPNPPSDVSANQIAPSVVQITWDSSPLDDAPDSYVIQRKISIETDWEERGSVDADENSFNDSLNTPEDWGEEFTYRVGARNSGGTTFSSDEDEITTDSANEILVGTWWASNPGAVGADSVKFEFLPGATNFRRTEYFDVGPLDAEIWDFGTYEAGDADILFHVTLQDNGPVDTTYTWEYDLEPSANDMSIQHENPGGDDWVNYFRANPVP